MYPEAVLSLAYRNIIILRRIGQTRYIGLIQNSDKWAYSATLLKNVRCLS